MRASRVGDAEARFWSRIDKQDDGCWNWTGAPSACGYGRIGGTYKGERIAPKEQTMLAHRFSWLIHNGPIPAHESSHGYVVMHTCDNRLCVNPSHLQLGLQADNVRDMWGKGRGVPLKPKFGADNHRSRLHRS